MKIKIFITAIAVLTCTLQSCKKRTCVQCDLYESGVNNRPSIALSRHENPPTPAELTSMEISYLNNNNFTADSVSCYISSHDFCK